MTSPTVEFDDRGFRLRDGDALSVVAEMAWSSVGSIWAYKIDLWSYDQVVFVFCYFHEPRTGDVEVSEESLGFKPFLAEVQRRFSLRADWFSAVAFPAFVENLTCLWPPQRTDKTRYGFA